MNSLVFCGSDLLPQTAEILFEVYDGIPSEGGTSSPPDADAPKFLGLGLVGIDELAAGPAVTQTLTLQPRPYDNDTVQGSIVVDFIFIENAELSQEQRSLALQMQHSFGPLDSKDITPSNMSASSSVQKVNIIALIYYQYFNVISKFNCFIN